MFDDDDHSEGQEGGVSEIQEQPEEEFNEEFKEPPN